MAAPYPMPSSSAIPQHVGPTPQSELTPLLDRNRIDFDRPSEPRSRTDDRPWYRLAHPVIIAACVLAAAFVLYNLTLLVVDILVRPFPTALTAVPYTYQMRLLSRMVAGKHRHSYTLESLPSPYSGDASRSRLQDWIDDSWDDGDEGDDLPNPEWIADIVPRRTIGIFSDHRYELLEPVVDDKDRVEFYSTAIASFDNLFAGYFNMPVVDLRFHHQRCEYCLRWSIFMWPTSGTVHRRCPDDDAPRLVAEVKRDHNGGLRFLNPAAVRSSDEYAVVSRISSDEKHSRRRVVIVKTDAPFPAALPALYAVNQEYFESIAKYDGYDGQT